MNVYTQGQIVNFGILVYLFKVENKQSRFNTEYLVVQYINIHLDRPLSRLEREFCFGSIIHLVS